MKRRIALMIAVAVFAGAAAPLPLPGELSPREQKRAEDDRLRPALRDGKWGFIDATGKWMIDPQFEAASLFCEGLANVKSNGLVGFIDERGKWVITPRFASAMNFSEGLVHAYLPNNRRSFYDKTGKLTMRADGIGVEVREGFIEHYKFLDRDATPDRLVGFVDTTGKVMIEPQFEKSAFCFFSEGLACMKLDNKYGFLRKDGTWAIKPQYDMARYFSEGIAPVQTGKMWHYIGKDGKELFEGHLFEDTHGFHEGLAAVKVAGKWGYLDRNGKMAINPKFEEVSTFFDRLAAFKEKEKWGYLNAKGEVVIRPQFDYAAFFLGELAQVDRDDRTGLINKQGRLIISWDRKKHQ